MKRIKSMNGYTIYAATERDEKKYSGITAGCFYSYFSSDIRDSGITFCAEYYEMEYGTIEDALNDIATDEYAIARELCEKESTCVSFEDIENKLAEMHTGRIDPDDMADIENVSPAIIAAATEKPEDTENIAATYAANHGEKMPARVNLINSTVYSFTGLDAIPARLTARPGDVITAAGITATIYRLYYSDIHIYHGRDYTTITVDIEFMDTTGQYRHYKSNFDKGAYGNTEKGILFTFD